MRKETLTIALLLAACAFIISLVYNPLPIPSSGNEFANRDSSTLEIAGRTIHVLIADTPEEREKGLSGHPGLMAGEGMLFVFPKDGRYAFWMKDMLFPIDIIWISYSGSIVDIRENATPESYPAAFTPREEARYVLELPQGSAEEYDLNIGDAVGLPVP